MPIAPAIIGAVASVGSQLLGNRARRKESDRALNRSKQMFDYQNAYNTPAKQMQRLREAGLNPALMYGQGTTGNAQGYPQMQPAQMQNPLQLDALRSIAEIKNIEAQTNKTNAEITLTDAKVKTELATQLNIDAQKAETIQNTLNLKTQDQLNKFTSAILEIKAKRATQKGIVPNDLYGNILDATGFDPKNNEVHRGLLQTALTAYFGGKAAKEVIQAITSMIKPTITNNYYPNRILD